MIDTHQIDVPDEADEDFEAPMPAPDDDSSSDVHSSDDPGEDLSQRPLPAASRTRGPSRRAIARRAGETRRMQLVQAIANRR